METDTDATEGFKWDFNLKAFSGFGQPRVETYFRGIWFTRWICTEQSGAGKFLVQIEHIPFSKCCACYR